MGCVPGVALGLFRAYSGLPVLRQALIRRPEALRTFGTSTRAAKPPSAGAQQAEHPALNGDFFFLPLIYPPTLGQTAVRLRGLRRIKLFSAKLFCMRDFKSRLTATEVSRQGARVGAAWGAPAAPLVPRRLLGQFSLLGHLLGQFRCRASYAMELVLFFR